MQSPPAPSGHPLVGHTIDYARDVFSLLDRAGEECGGCFRLSLLGVGDTYVLAEPALVERVLIDDRDAFCKGENFELAFGEALPAVDGEAWRGQREHLREFFYPARIRSYAETMVDVTEARVGEWADGERRSLHEEMGAIALENLFATLFDRRLEPGEDDAIREAAGDLNAWFEATSWVLPTWVPTPGRRRFSRAVDTLRAEARRLLADRDADGDDLLSALVEGREAGNEAFSERANVDQVIGFTFAGHDTTSLALTVALYELGTRPALRERFHAELEAVLDGATPTRDDVADLELTRRVVREAVRLHPPVHTIPRETTRAVDLGEYRLPAGAAVSISAYRLHRDERFWDDPASFRPARWTETSPREKGFAYVPFGGGPRACIGRRFALLEATLVLATIGQRFHLEPRSSLELVAEMTTQPADGVPVRVHAR